MANRANRSGGSGGSEEGNYSGPDYRPIPDPTLLTTQQLLREIAALKDLVFTRLDGMDRAIILFNENITRVPTDTDKQIGHLKELTTETFLTVSEKFCTFHTQLKEREARWTEIATENSKALQVAHEAQTNTFDVKLDAVRDVSEARLERLLADFTQLSAYSHGRDVDINNALLKLQELHEVKFEGVEKQFVERDTRTEQTSRDSKVAVDAALQAAKEAVGEQNKSNALAIAKSEAAFTKQIDQIGIIISTTTKGTDDKIDDMKNRLTLIEGKSGVPDPTLAELRLAMTHMMPIDIYDQRHSELQRQVNDLRESWSTNEGRSSGSREEQTSRHASQASSAGFIGAVVGIIGALLGIGGLIIAVLHH